MEQLVVISGVECMFVAGAHVVMEDGEVHELPLDIVHERGAPRLRFDLSPVNNLIRPPDNEEPNG